MGAYLETSMLHSHHVPSTTSTTPPSLCGCSHVHCNNLRATCKIESELQDAIHHANLKIFTIVNRHRLQATGDSRILSYMSSQLCVCLCLQSQDVHRLLCSRYCIGTGLKLEAALPSAVAQSYCIAETAVRCCRPKMAEPPKTGVFPSKIDTNPYIG